MDKPEYTLDELLHPPDYAGMLATRQRRICPTEGDLVAAARQLLLDALNERDSVDRPRSQFTAEQVDAAKFILMFMIVEPE
jgi:hypothetical protein